jgi:hypothetical protein
MELQLRVQGFVCASSAATMGSFVFRQKTALRLMARATWWWPIFTTIAFKYSLQ